MTYVFTYLPKGKYPVNTERRSNVATTSMRCHDVAATSKQRYFDVLCLQRIGSYIALHKRDVLINILFLLEYI